MYLQKFFEESIENKKAYFFKKLSFLITEKHK